MKPKLIFPHYNSYPLFLLAFLLSLGVITPAFSSTNPEDSEEFDVSEMIMHHILDSHEWEFAKIGDTHITLPLPVILYTENGLDVFMSSELHHAEPIEVEHEGEKVEAQKLVRGNNTYIIEHGKIHLENGGTLIDLSITKNVAALFLSVLLMMLIFFTIGKAYTKNQGKAPSGIQSFFEPIIIFIRDDIARDSIGPKYERFLPYLFTVFFFILFNNLLGLFPSGANLTGNIAVTMVLALITLLITLFSSNRNYWNHIFNTPGVPWWLKTVIPIMPIVEFIGIFTKPFALMVRLFANITAGHIIMLSLFSLIFIFKSIAVAPISLAFATAMNFLELLVAFLQAYVFTLLSALYFAGAVEEHHDEAH